ncbi:synapse-associated protein 1 isoform X1 [Otolemur garnettii]|uniref:synapse-associated protein 1 isoform X1 n=1 Tax=Otolemur garnettii TaxID=30611 RepID=UPI000C7EB1CA|nr:synapse-associated protein 1 isoform X1 [Otolemur garnettii]
MFRGLGVWLGLQQPAEGGGESEGDRQPEKDSPPEQQSETVVESAEQEREQAGDQELLNQAKGLGNYLFNFATAATKKLTESVAETAQTIKKSVEEGKIDDIFDKTIIGDFHKEQKKFVEEQHTKKSEAAVPPWVDSNDEETIQQQILALSADKRNFLRDPPAGVQFNFDFDQMYPVALVMLQEDELLSKMRFSLVPKLVKEEVFWRNYFYRVSLIKQSAQLTALAAQQQAAEKEEKNSSRQEDSQLAEAVRPKTPPVVIKSQLKTQEDEEEISTSPGVSEFVSDAFDACNLNQEDLRKEMEQLVLDKKQEKTTVLEEAVRPKTPPVVIKSQLKTQEDEEEISTSPGVSEFVSDAFDACNLNQEDLRKEMEQLVLDKKQEKTTVLEEDSADWEKELQQELQEYEVVAESEKRDENWDKEIEKMLQEEN